MSGGLVRGESPPLRRLDSAVGARTGAIIGPVVLKATIECAGENGQLGRVQVPRRQMGCTRGRDAPRRSSRLQPRIRTLFHAARSQDIESALLPDFLGLEHGGELTLLGQEELDLSVLEAVMSEQVARLSADDARSERDTERILLAAARVGQHVFAREVLANCGNQCVFCGLRPSSFGAKRMLLAGHIKPWKDSTPSERLDHLNGIAACPAHDVAFDTGMLTVNGDLRIHIARPLAEAIVTDPLARQYYGRPPLLDTLLLPDGAQSPATRYLDWHRQRIFVA
jgi:putative restriction endonuclease